MDSERVDGSQAALSTSANAGLRSDAAARELEAGSVQAVYEAIASHFSDTRYKARRGVRLARAQLAQPWPLIVEFLSSLSPGSIGLESGSGNGKNLGLGSIFLGPGDAHRERGDRVILGLDRYILRLRPRLTPQLASPVRNRSTARS